MARRSPMNPRYGKDAKVGTTRRSASSAKPKREIGMTPASKPTPSSATKADRPSLRDAVPTSPEIKKWRIVWGVLFGVMLVDAAISNFVPAVNQNPVAMQVSFAVLLVAFIGSLYIELVVIRRLRKELIAEKKAAGKKVGKDGK